MFFKIKLHYFFIAAGLIILAVVSPAQQPFIYKYTIEHGLPFAEVDGIHFSKNGEAWVRYSNGEVLSRFDGINWTHYRLGEMHLPLGLNFVTEDEHGTWFYSSSNEYLWLVCLTSEGVWKKYYLKGRYSLYFTKKNNEFALLDDQLYPHQYDAKTDRVGRSEKPLYAPDESKGESFYSIITTKEGSPILLFKSLSQDIFLFRYGEGFQYSLVSPASDFQPIYVDGKHLCGLFIKDGKCFWWDGSKSKALEFILPNGRKGKPIQPTPFHFFGGKKRANSLDGMAVEDPVSRALYLFAIDSIGNVKLLLEHVSKDCFFRIFSQDKSGNWWYGTSSGLVRSDQSQLVFDESMSGMVTGLHTISEDEEGNIWMGGYTGSGGFTVYDGKKLQRQILNYSAMPVLPGTYRSVSGTLHFFVETPRGIMAIKNGNFFPLNIKMEKDGYPALGFYFHPLRNGQIALGLGGTGLGIATETEGLISSIQQIGKEKGMLLDNVLTVTEDETGRLWAGRISQGVAIYDPQRDTATTWLRSPEVPNSIGVMASCVDENGTLWLGTNKGIRLLRNAHQFDYLNENLFAHLKKIPLPGTDTGSVSLLKNTESYIVAGTKYGVYFFDKKYNGERPRIFSMQFGKDIAGDGAEQNAVLLDSKGYLWIGTQSGATRLDIDSLRFDTSAITLVLTEFLAGDAQISLKGNDLGKLPKSKRNLRFSFAPSGNSYLKDNLFYDVVAIKEDGDTLFQRLSTHQKDGLQIDHLPYGDYTLQIVAYKHNVLSGKVEYRFTVPRLLGESPWFWVITTSFFMGALLTFIYFRKRHQLELEKSKRERDSLKVQALANFFNPHFINNSLHWVQGKYRKDPETAIIIGRLADNVNLLYKNIQSGKTYHPLEQELHIVTNYLKIQQVCFGGELIAQYDFLEESGSYNGIYVPAMLLQIHAENAVEKGIRNRKGASNLTLSVKREPEGCLIIIEDDGRGRPLMPEERIVERKGSTEVMDDLVDLFNLYNSVPLTVKYHDRIFKGMDENGYGTRVLIFIPKNFNYEFS